MLIKICGVQSVEIAKAVEASGADYMGFVFAPSRRFIKPEQASRISREVKHVCKVGVFVDEQPQVVHEIAMMCNLDFIQLHGNESLDYAKQMQYPVIKAFRYTRDLPLVTMLQYPAQMILMDTYQCGVVGGTGKQFDWQEAQEKLRQLSVPLFVAGGIHQGNVDQMMHFLRPQGIDVSGGVEVNGVKSAEKIYEFVRTAHEAERRLSEC